MGFKRTMDRIKKRIRGRKKILLACIVVLLTIMGMTIGEPYALGNTGEDNADLMKFCATCRDHAYVGLDGHDYLTLYDGDPKRGIVVRRLFKVDLELAENSLPPESVDELISGIQVAGIEEYNSVLSTFSDYAAE